MNRATEDRSRPNTGKRGRRRLGGKALLVGTVVVLAMLWVTYWYGASQIGAAVLDRIAAATAARGYTAACENAGGGGFPLSLDLSCSRASLAGAQGELSAAVDGIAATSPLYRPGRIEWTAAGPLVVDLPDTMSDLTATWQTMQSKLDAGIGGLSGMATRLSGLAVDLPAGPAAQAFVRLNLADADLSVFPGPDDDYRLSASARALVLETGDDRVLPAIDLDADLTALDIGTSLGLDPRQALADWLVGGGVLRIDDLAVVADTVSAKSSGTLALSPDGKLSGDLDVTMSGIEALPGLVESFYPEARDKVEQIVAAITAFTRPVDTPDGPARRMTLLVRDSVVSIGILPIGVIPTIAF